MCGCMCECACGCVCMCVCMGEYAWVSVHVGECA